MEIILGAIADYIAKNMRKRSVIKYVLLALIVTLGCGLAYMEWAVLLGR